MIEVIESKSASGITKMKCCLALSSIISSQADLLDKVGIFDVRGPMHDPIAELVKLQRKFEKERAEKEHNNRTFV